MSVLVTGKRQNLFKHSTVSSLFSIFVSNGAVTFTIAWRNYVNSTNFNRSPSVCLLGESVFREGEKVPHSNSS